MIWRATAAMIYIALMHTAIVLQIDSLRVASLAILVTLIHSALPRRPATLFSWVLSLALLGLLASFGQEMWLAFATPVLVHLAMFSAFATTLRPNETPLITRIAESMRGELPEDVVVYCRHLTIAWAVLLGVMTIVSIILPMLEDLVLWSYATNFGNYLAIAALFAAEYGYRRLRFPRHDHLSFRNHLKRVVATYPQASRRG